MIDLIDSNLYLEKILNLIELPDNPEIERQKFTLLDGLLTNLCKNTNNIDQFNDILNLILLFLLTYKEKYQFDEYSNQNHSISLKEKNKIKNYLKKEIL